MENSAQGLSLYTEVEFARLGRLLLSRLRRILLCGLAGLILAGAAMALIPPRYQSYVTFYVRNGAQTGAVSNSDLLAAEALTATYIQLLQSNRVTDAVLARLQAACPEEELDREAVRGMAEISILDGTQILRLTVSGRDAQRAFRIADAYASEAPALLMEIAQSGWIEVVDGAERPAVPAAPRRAAGCCLGFLAGAVLSGLYFIIRETAAPRQKRPAFCGGSQGPAPG